MNGFDEAVEEIKTAIEGNQDKDSIIEYKPFILS